MKLTRSTKLPYGTSGFLEVEVDVVGVYRAGAPATETDPGWAAEAEVHAVLLGGVDIADSLSEADSERCYQALLAAGPGALEATKEGHTDQMRESARGMG